MVKLENVQLALIVRLGFGWSWLYWIEIEGLVLNILRVICVRSTIGGFLRGC